MKMRCPKYNNGCPTPRCKHMGSHDENEDCITQNELCPSCKVDIKHERKIKIDKLSKDQTL